MSIKESSQGEQRKIGKIYCNFFVFHMKFVGDIFMFVKNYLFVVGQTGTKDHWLNPLKSFKHNYVKVFEKISVYKNSC